MNVVLECYSYLVEVEMKENQPFITSEAMQLSYAERDSNSNQR